MLIGIATLTLSWLVFVARVQQIAVQLLGGIGYAIACYGLLGGTL